ncbi:MAG: RDD family protein [Desulfurococcales archaeon]|nr:RDD family protein [Desulfurococcales archaeon]
MTSEEAFFEALSNSIRREIIVLLYDRIELTYSDLSSYLGISSGLLNFHLKKLDGLIEKTPDNTYKLTQLGRLAYRFITEVRAGSEGSREQKPKAEISGSLVARRVIATVIDILAIFIATGALFDPQILGLVGSALLHLDEVLTGHPWVFHSDHLRTVLATITEIVGTYSHVFFATYIFLTLLEAYKGQTIGKFLLGIRVVKRNGRRINLVESGIRNAGKLFLLPIDLAIGVILYYKRGYLRYTDYYIDAVVERVEGV